MPESLIRQTLFKVSNIYKQYHTGVKRWEIPYETKTDIKRRYLTKLNDIASKKCVDMQTVTAMKFIT